MRKSWVVLLIVLLAAGGGWYWRATHPEAVAVKVATVTRGRVEATVANTRAGTVKACRRARMSPSLGGQISALPFHEGDRVKAGEVLLALWNEDLKAEVAHAGENLAAARKSARAACLQAALAKRTASRTRRLFQSGSVSRERYDQVKAEAEAGQAKCEAANASEQAAEAALRVAKTRLERTILKAPFDGVIAKINGELNEYVTPSPPGILTPPVIDLIEPDCFYVSAPIDEVDAPRIQPGMKARITLDAWKGRIFDGEVTRIGAYVVDREKQARRVEVRLKFTHPEDLKDLLTGYSADVDIITAAHDGVLRIPAEALIDDDHVLRYDGATGRLEKVRIEKGLTNWDWVEVKSGLAPGDRVVVSHGDEAVKDGALARIAADDG